MECICELFYITKRKNDFRPDTLEFKTQVIKNVPLYMIFLDEVFVRHL